MAVYSVVITVSFARREMVAAEQAKCPPDTPWEVVFGQIKQLHCIELSPASDDDGELRLIFTVWAIGFNSDRATNRAKQILKRGLSERPYGPSRVEWALVPPMQPLTQPSPALPQPAQEAKTVADAVIETGSKLRRTPLQFHEVDKDLLQRITAALIRISEEHGWVYTDWSAEMRWRSGSMSVALTMDADGRQIAQVNYAGQSEAVYIPDAPRRIPQILTKLMRTNPSPGT